MLRWSVYAIVVLYMVIWPGTVHGTMEADVDVDRRPLVDKITALVEKINKQEDRLQTVETQLAKHTVALLEKDRRIRHLEQEIEDLKSKAATSNTSLYATKSNDRIIRGKNQDESETNFRGKNQSMSDQNRRSNFKHNWTNHAKPGRKQSIRVTDFDSGDRHRMFNKAGLDVSFEFEGKPSKPKAIEHGRTFKIRRTRRVMQQAKRVNNVSPEGYAFSLFLSANTNVVPHDIIQYDGIMIDAGNGYNHGNGIYEVPISGVYVFTWSTISGHNGGDLRTQLFVNGVSMSASDADSDPKNWESATGLIVTSVKAGDHVYIRAYESGQLISYNLARSTFSGWLCFRY